MSGYCALKEKGMVVHFNDCAADKRFETSTFKPVNVTEDIASKLVDRFNKVAKRYAGPIGWAVRKFDKFKKSLNF